MSGGPLRVRWLGRVRYRDAHELMSAIHRAAAPDTLLLLEHPHVYTMGVRARAEHVLGDPEAMGAEVVRADRGGDVTYHGPGQLVGYPIVSVPVVPGATPRYVAAVEQVVIDALGELGLAGAERLEGYPGVWVGGNKIAAVGVRLTRGRSMHGFALNVDTDLAMFDHIVPCGIRDRGVTSLAAEGVPVTMCQVVDVIAARAALVWGDGGVERQDVAWPAPAPDLAALSPPAGGPGQRAPVRLLGRLAAAGVDPGAGLDVSARKPEWLRLKVEMGPGYRGIRRTMRDLDLATVCEEAGCPNVFECWNDGTATFMINGSRCTRACGFCLVDTRLPEELDVEEPERVAEAVARMGLAHAVVTAVARDDVADGGAAGFAATVAAIRRRCPATTVEILVPDCKGDPEALDTLFAARPDVLNHNLETVARLQRAVRPQASYARSLAVLARAKQAGLTTKSGVIVGMGETVEEVLGAVADLRCVGVDIVTIGQYLRPSAAHLPVARWWAPEEFDRLRVAALAMGFAHVEASPLTRSSYHARQALAGSGVQDAASSAGGSGAQNGASSAGGSGAQNGASSAGGSGVQSAGSSACSAHQNGSAVGAAGTLT